MGRTSTAIKPFPTYNSPKPIRGSWESNPARVKACKNYNMHFVYLECSYAYTNQSKFYPRASGYIRLVCTGGS
jgi:hypothetical protein